MPKPFHSFVPRLLTLTVRAALLIAPVVVCGVAPGVHAQAVPATHAFDIPAGALSTALTRVATQAGVQLTADAALTAGKKAVALSGSMTVDQALARLLAGSGIEAVAQPGGGYVLRKSTGDEVTLTPVKVRAPGDQESAFGPVKGYVAKRSATGTKTDTPLLETPQSISVVTREAMDMQAVQTSEQALRYTAGVLTEVTGYDLRYQSLTVRGFYTANYRDGLRTFTAGSYADWVVEPQGLERVELIKGPASVMYGQATPGGIVNQLSKRPVADAFAEVGFSAGSYDRYETTLDAGSPLTADGTVLFRINAMARDSGVQTDHSDDDRLFLAPALTWTPSADTTVTLLADVTRDRMTPKSWWPDYALVDHNPNGHIPVSRFTGEPGVDRYDRDAESIAYLLEHDVDDSWMLRQNLRYSHFKLDYIHVYGDVFESDLRTLDRGVLVSRPEGHALTADNQLITRFATGSVRHQLLVGVDYQRFSGSEDLGFGAAPPLDAFNPIYGALVELPETTRNYSRLDQTGLYAQDQLRLDAWILNVGLRHDQAKTRNWDVDGWDIDQDDAKTTYNVGVLYLTEAGFAPYASYSTSFSPSVDVTFDNRPFEPETARQYEAGVKYQPAAGNGLLTLSLFDLRKQNVATDDPDHQGYSIQTGEVRSRGVELEGTFALSSRLNGVASYTWLDAEVTRSNDPAERGNQPRQTARNTAALWLDYQLDAELLRGWRVAGGVRYVDKVAADNSGSRFNPSYTLVDAALRYEQGPVALTLNAVNLFDKVYVANRAQFYGQGRTLQARLVYRWQ